MNGNQIVAMENISNRGSDSRGWNILWLGGNFSNGANKPTKGAADRFIDNVRWYSTKP
jgi:hypothetical protein